MINRINVSTPLQNKPKTQKMSFGVESTYSQQINYVKGHNVNPAQAQLDYVRSHTTTPAQFQKAQIDYLTSHKD